MSEIVFGTDGWRDVIADGFIVARVRRAAYAYATHLAEAGPGLVLVGHDTRFGGAMFASAAADALRAAGHRVLLHEGPVPTPALSLAVRRLGAAGAVMLTASHNPAAYGGLKLKESYGGTASPETYADVARRANASRDEDVPKPPPGSAAGFDARDAYFDHLASALDLPALRAWRGTLVHDAMHGAAAGWLEAFAARAGLPCRVVTLRGWPDPTFGGAHPEPVPANLGPLVDEVHPSRPAEVLGIATDGDGDRLGVVPAGGPALSAHAALALIVDHLERRGGRGRVVHTLTVSRIVGRLARARGLEAQATPIGFKHLVPRLLEGGVLVAGEESGGYAVEGGGPERDGLLSGLVVLEALVRSGDLRKRFAELEHETGWRHAYDRRDLQLPTEAARAALASLDHPPAEVAGRRVTHVARRDGVTLDLGDDAWLHVRGSGTEPVLRLYCEAADDASVGSILDAAETLVRRPLPTRS